MARIFGSISRLHDAGSFARRSFKQGMADAEAGRVVDLQVQATVEVSAMELENIRREIRRALAELGIESAWEFEDVGGE